MTISTKDFIVQCKQARDLSRLLAESISVMNNSTLIDQQKAHVQYQQEIVATLTALQTINLSPSEQKEMDIAQNFLQEIVHYNGLAVKNARNSQAIIGSELTGVKSGRSALSGYSQYSPQTSYHGKVVHRVG